MTNEEVMKMLTDMGLHEGGMDNWLVDNAWVKFANITRNATLDEIAKKIEAMPFGDTAASFAIWIREQKT